MKTLILVVLALFAGSVSADTYVNGYTRRDGTYVQGHMRSDANDTRNDNYSTRGNSNPYTGSYGTKPRDEDSNNSYRNPSYNRYNSNRD